MLEALTGLGLASAAGLNAYIPMLAMGLLSRFTDLLSVPPGWAWLENEWVMVILGVLLVIDMVADKIPAVDSVNDIIQTVVRPASGGIVFGSGSASETVAVTDPESFVSSGQWVPIVTGIVIALLVHLAKAAIRPIANAATFGLAAPVLSTVEDGASIVLVVLAIVVPVLVVLALAGLIVLAIVFVRRRRRASATSPRPA
ncbi:uncharacterized protein DUF4126 [Labedella gwakjiensis]|uniref:DUF4126 domain-containing protein n=1 Tax=Labedella gwakjiensis TaxID=390269 RepID=A0A2P8GSE6_9MICO|nr:DUF4126 domain-containing protein [Labedella gwakjiensis]PSL36875.1 uncharacterized protein DUF4126 [Labedella gwakjiensis]RUQ84372.1 DUF4126 domain-containing protein [Labedella gwakjiensis]